MKKKKITRKTIEIQKKNEKKKRERKVLRKEIGKDERIISQDIYGPFFFFF